MPSRCNILSWILSNSWGNFLGVDYSCGWCYWVEPLN
jgi:hypothetical protein